MDGGFLVLLIFAFVMFGFIAAAVSAERRRKTVESYTQLAQHFGGTCDPGGWPKKPRVQFSHSDCLVIIDVFSTGGDSPTYYTQARFVGGRQPAVRCEIYPEKMWSLRKLFGMQDIEIGSPDFDSQYIIKGEDNALLRSLLGPAVQSQIEQLRRFLANDDIYVSFDTYSLLVKKRSFLRDYQMLLRFTELAIGLYDQTVLAGEVGIKFTEATPQLKLGEAICQICGEKIKEDVVFCRRCRTPHHQDCWEYFGACSTYGCRETQYMRPESRQARRAQKQMARSA